MSTFKDKYFLITAFLVTLICCIPLFADLGKPPIYMWDEATYVNNAIDMYVTHDPIVVRMEGNPDLYNTKPPFVLWMQTLSMHLFGLNEFAVRFPSALFASLALLLLLWFSITVFNSPFIGFVAMLTLICSNGYVSDHGARSGDLDATMVFWMMLYTLIYLKFLIRFEKTGLHFAIISIGLIGAFLSKGIAGFFFVPFLIMVTVLHGNFIRLLKQKQIYISSAIVLIVCSGYYFIRESAAPGYLDVVFKSEFSRYGKPVMSWHVEPFGFYFRNFISGRFTPFIYLLPFSLLVPFISKDKTITKMSLYLCTISLGYFFLISYPADKLDWYDEPLYPLFSLIIGIFIATLIKKIIEILKYKPKRISSYLISLILITLIFFLPYKNTVTRVLTDDHIRYTYDTSQTDIFRINGAYMKYIHEHFPEQKIYTVFKSPPYDPEHEDQLKFYQRIYNLCDSNHIQIKHLEKELSPGESVLVCEKSKLDSLQHDFSLTVLNSWNGCSFIQINDRKEKNQ